MRYIAALIFLTLFSSCKSDTEIVTTHQWKGGGISCLGDMVRFTDDFSSEQYDLFVMGDTIYNDSEYYAHEGKVPIAMIEDVSWRYGHYVLTIRFLHTGETCTYFEKGDVDNECVRP